jgi:hypothetical protein
MLKVLTEAARALVSSLDDRQRAVALRPITDDDLRHRWAYTPGPRAGVVLGELGRSQRKAVHQLLATVLSTQAYAQVATIMALEDVLDYSERDERDRNRHQGDYSTVLFGMPDDDAWGWRFEGHHVSVNVVVAHGQVSATPFFLGANPARTSYAGRSVVQPLRLEEELPRELLDRMGSANRLVAVVSPDAPPDLRTRNAPWLGSVLEPAGIASTALDGSARELLTGIVRYYLDRLDPELAAAEFDRIDPERLHFAWEGSSEPGSGHYYRIQTPDLLLEYDNTQAGANHVHSVWRRRSGDFGDDLLAAHRTEVDH